LYDLINRLNGTDLKSYNIISGSESQIYVTTNQGIYSLEKGRISSQVSEITKWGELDYSTDTFKSTTKLELIERDKLNLESSRDNFYYRIIDEQLIVYNKRLYRKYLEDISIRAISTEFIGTYDGIYDSNLKRLDNYPSYSSGKIRKIGDKTFVIYDGLFYAEDNQTHYFKSPLNEIEIDERSLGFGQDIFPLNQAQYLLFTSNGVWVTDLSKVEALDLSKLKDRSKLIKFIHQYEDDGRILYIMDNQLKIIGSNLKSYVLIDFEEEIIDITKSNHDSDIYFLSNQSIGIIRNGKVEKIVENSAGFHTIIPLPDHLALTSDQGLFRLKKKSLALDIIIEEEFNKQSLEKIQDSIWAGSVSGLYKIALKDFENYSSEEIRPKSTSSFQWILYCLIAILSIIILILRYKLKSESTTTRINETITREMILEFIKSNIATVTLLSIQEAFNISYRKLKNTLGDSPGRVIEIERKKVLNARLKEGKSFKEVSNLTGYSVEYIRRISKNPKN
jgi:hypothetical protein